MNDATAPPIFALGVPDAATLDDLEQNILDDAQSVDASAMFPHDSIDKLAASGLLSWPIGIENLGQRKSDSDALCDLLIRIGRASLTVGRLFEGHINAAILLKAYGTDANRALLLKEAQKGRISGVWNAERGTGVTAKRTQGGWLLFGEKIFCSGAGSIVRPIVTARTKDKRNMLMMMPRIEGTNITTDLSKWRSAGMRGTATGTVIFDDVHVSDCDVVGDIDDYYRSPLFSGGAWRVLAVQLGGLQHITALHAYRLVEWNRTDEAHLRARFAQAAQNLEMARLVVKEAESWAQDDQKDPGAIDAYVDGARGAFESLAMSIIENTRRNIGLSSYIAPDPLDLVIRDLETYLRQPFLDASRDNAALWLLRHEGRFVP